MEDTAEKISKFLFGIVGIMLFGVVLLSLADFVMALLVQTEAHALLDKALFTLILVELFHFTIIYVNEAVVDPHRLLLIVLIAVGRRLIVADLFHMEPLTLIAVGVVFVFCIYGIKVTSPASK